MKKQISIACFIVLLSGITATLGAQNRGANFWYFGANAGMQFTSGNPAPAAGGMVSTIEGSAVISDSSTGNLLFYTDGSTVWNRNHAVMTNGTGLMGSGTSFQTAIIVPSPAKNNRFYIFTTPASGDYRYSVVDMSLSGGLGSVTTKNVTLVTSVTERQDAVRHANGRDYWTVCHSSGNSSFYAFHVTPTGINPVVLSVAGPAVSSNIGGIRISPDGSYLVLTEHGSGDAHLYDFNTSTGAVTNHTQLLTGMSKAVAAAFSADGTRLYIAAGTNYKDIYQFDMCAGDRNAIAASSTFIASSAASWGGAMQLGPDGKIYFSHYSTATLGVINSPSALGTACNYVDNGFNLGGPMTRIGLPGFVQSYFNTGGTCTVLNQRQMDLQAKPLANVVELSWEWSGPESAQFFRIERSNDGLAFHSIGKTNGARGLNWIDESPLNGENFYRITAIQPDGESSYSEVESAWFLPGGQSLSATPNPFRENLQLSLTSVQAGTVHLSLMDATGRELMRAERAVPEGKYDFNLNTSELSSGVYFVKLTDPATGRVNLTQKVIRL